MAKKEKEKSIRQKVTREFSSGGVVFKKMGGKTYWLITKSTPSKLFSKAVWRLPKGHLDNNESAEQAATREVCEEGGVKAKILKKVEIIKYLYTHPEKGKIFKIVTFYLMEWINDTVDGFDNETSEIAWLELDDACKMLTFPSEKAILKKSSLLYKSSI